VHFHAERVRFDAGPGVSIEAAAREARYAALVRLARAADCDTVLLAHHREDQAETVLLQALRGAGPAGLAAMPQRIERFGLTWLRPWLAQPRSAIDAYVRRHRLRHIEDDSNTDTRYARNKLRHEVWPALLQAFPQAPQVLGTVAQHAQDAAQCLAELAELDLHQIGAGLRLDVAALLALGPARGRNALRIWLARVTSERPAATLVQRLWAELAAHRQPEHGAASWPVHGGGVLRLYRGQLGWQPAASVAVTAEMAEIAEEVVIFLDGPGFYPAPAWRGVLQVEAVPEQGMAARAGPVQLRARRGAEQFQRAPGTPPRSLKKQFQAAGVPAWQRQAPLIWQGERLLHVPGLGLDARCLAGSGEPRWRLVWLPDSPAGEGGCG
jgi:tRNA(Ile)-lysidine synthase